MPKEAKTLLELHGLSKIYPSVIANDKVSLSVDKGQIHAVLGENGAGKSTLMKMIYGITPPDKGYIKWQDEVVDIINPSYARKLGIGMIFQHFALFETLTVVENVALALDDKPALKPLAEKIKSVSEHYGLPIQPHRLVHALSVGERQRLEIVRCLLQKPKLLIMDEPTSVLTPSAVRTLFKTLRQLSKEGCSILYISHKLDEIQELCDVATVLRNGKVMGKCIPSQETAKSLAGLMIGKPLALCKRDGFNTIGELRLQLNNLSYENDDPFATSLKAINLSLRSGEIIGIAGVSGNGQQELLRALSGEQALIDHQSVQICGRAVASLGPQARRALGFCLVPEERLAAVVAAMSLNNNSLLTAHQHGMVANGLMIVNKIKHFTSTCIQQFNVKCGGSTAAAQSLSGGNLQKFIIGREILQAPKILVVAQPTWGVDMAAAVFIRQQLIDLSKQGTAVLVLSEELDELFEISDQLAVIADGALSPLTKTADTSMEQIGVWMSGIWPGANAQNTQELNHASA